MYPDDIPYEVKHRRNIELLELQNRICEQDNQPFLGQRVDVLVEGVSKVAIRKEQDQGDVVQLMGRTPCDRIVMFEGNRRLIGEIIPVAIYEVDTLTLFGVVVTQHVVPLLQPIVAGR